MKRPAVFIDRDGTVNEQMGYINHPNRFKLLPGAAEAIRLLNRNRILAIIVSNQSGVARGYFPIELVHEVHRLMESALEKQGARIDGIFFCPHHPQGVVPEFKKKCDCRKPGTGMVDLACRSFEIDKTRSYLIGDRYLDIETAERAGLKGILVKTGYGLGDLTYIFPQRPLRPCYIADDLLQAVQWVLKREG
ncbi:MAG: HAD family hydrolase [Deltaproteobacteria bacterium]|nr:HAD family hydrolase [Deltaproteobacteria bacterium]MBW2015279.1 HAD family hydrolase [Deltaproteobacteria bacterium]MBW2127811.1 HAD family hydrolase [Deltaproteobacteria bacterium]MBW2302095.1 HAD family hydrolase [Deltaproteobacteria bacterium]